MGVVPSGFLITGQCGATYQLPAQHLRPASEGWLNNLALLPGDQARHQACGPQEGCDHIWDKRTRREKISFKRVIYFLSRSAVRTHFCINLDSVKFPWLEKGSRMILIQKNYHQRIF